MGGPGFPDQIIQDTQDDMFLDSLEPKFEPDFPGPGGDLDVPLTPKDEPKFEPLTPEQEDSLRDLFDQDENPDEPRPPSEFDPIPEDFDPVNCP